MLHPAVIHSVLHPARWGLHHANGDAHTESGTLLTSPRIGTLRARSIRQRLADREKWPRKWWRPLPEELKLSNESWKKQHDEISKAINRLLLLLIGFCFFCWISLGAPDRSLLASDAKIKLPFADIEISFVAFLIVAPVVLTALSFYLHIFAGYWINLMAQSQGHGKSDLRGSVLPFVFNLKYLTATGLSYFLFYWLVPITLAVFAWKALPRPEAPILIALTSIFISVFLFLQIRRRPDSTNKILWLMFVCAIALTLWASVYGGTLTNRLRRLRQLDLRRADLSGQDLRFVNLQNADLEEANLIGSNLSYATLNRANLKGATLVSADLSNARLTGVDLTNANVKLADFKSADLEDANLRDTDLTGAILNGATLCAFVGGAVLGRMMLGSPYSMLGSASKPVNPARNLTQQQINSAIGDEKTVLPPGFVMPEAWSKKGTP